MGTGERREVCLEELWCGKEEVWCAASMKELEHVRGRDAKAQGQQEGGEVQLERAQRIVETVERIEAQRVEWRGQGGKGREKEQVRKWCGELEEPIGVRTYYRYRQQYEQAGGQVAVLAGMLRRRTYQQTQMSRAQLHLAETVLLRWYASRPGMRPAMGYRLMVAQLPAEDEGLLD